MIPQAEFHGAPCSDLVGTQRNVDELLNLLDNSTTGRKWNLDGEAPQYNYINSTGGKRQVWKFFRTPSSSVEQSSYSGQFLTSL